MPDLTWFERFKLGNSDTAASCGAVLGPIADFVEKVGRLGLACGSRAWGLAGDASDYDYVIFAAQFPEIDLRILEKSDYSNLPTPGFYVAYRSRYVPGGFVLLNVLVCRSQEEYQAWQTCVMQMRDLLQHPLLFDLCRTKAVRVALFQELRNRAGLRDDDEAGTPEHPNIMPFKPVGCSDAGEVFRVASPYNVPSPDDDPPF